MTTQEMIRKGQTTRMEVDCRAGGHVYRKDPMDERISTDGIPTVGGIAVQYGA
jgi:hypothetical protein